jgi:DNA-binding transcriptional MerR regulator
MNTGNNEENKYYSIGEVSELTDVKPTVLRFWETEFPKLTPIKNKFGHRVYSEKDIEIIIKIKTLLYEEGLTIKGAKSFFENETKTSGFNTKSIRRKLEDILKILKNKEE